MRGHLYHRQCGCYSCGLHEEALERAEECAPDLLPSNPHLEMANEVFNMMFGLPKIAPPEPLISPDHEGESDENEENSHD